MQFTIVFIAYDVNCFHKLSPLVVISIIHYIISVSKSHYFLMVAMVIPCPPSLAPPNETLIYEVIVLTSREPIYE
jgi:hypothetical protein